MNYILTKLYELKFIRLYSQNLTDMDIKKAKINIDEKINLLEIFIKRLKNILPEIIISFIVFFISYFIAKQVKKILKKVAKKDNADTTIVNFVSQVIYVTILIIGLVISLTILGVNSSPFVAAIGAIGISIGLALQNNLSNFASGIIILIFKPFKIGDFIEIKNSVSGTVFNITSMNTCLNTIDNKKIYIPNSLLTSDYVINYSQNYIRYLILNFKITYTSNHNKAIELLKQSAKDNNFLEDNSNIVCEISELNPMYVNIFLKAEVNNKDYFPAQYLLLKNIKEKFEENNIEFAVYNNLLYK